MDNWEIVGMRNTVGGESWQGKSMIYVPLRHSEIAMPVENPDRDVQKTVSYMNPEFKKGNLLEIKR